MSIVPAAIARQPWGILTLVGAIVGFGLVVLYSAAGGSVAPWALAQGLRFAVFLAAALFFARLPVRLWEQWALVIFAAVALLLLAVELVGAVKGGSQRWINIGILNLQPSELMKVAIVLAMARVYAQMPPAATQTFRALVPAAILIGIPALLVLLQPDLGTALAIIVSGLTVLFLAGPPLRWFLISGGAFLAALPVLFSTLHDYQQRRVLIFLDPESDPLGAGYHISQSKIAIGSGGLWGKGFLNGSQSHLDYLPEGHTDFIFSTMTEEWGLVGGALLILAYMLMLNWGTRVAVRAPTNFGRLTAAGLTMTIFFYLAINLMMVMGLAPVVGIPLPLFSYGGSSMMTIMGCLAILLAIDREGQAAGRR